MILRETGIRAKNSAIIAATGRRNIKTASFLMFTNSENASWALQSYMSELSYPLASFSFPVGRKGFRLKPGDLFLLSYSPYGISNTVVRVIAIEEEALDSERLNITVVEDINYKTNRPTVTIAENQAGFITETTTVETLDAFFVVESPYIYSDTPNTIIPIIGRKTQTETGVLIYVSVDGGSSYSLLGRTSTFSVVCELESSLYAEDSSDSFDVSISIGASRLSSDANAHIKKTNLLKIGNEVISFTDIEANSSGTYTISGLLRGVFDTTIEDHVIDSSTSIQAYSLDGLSSITSSIFVAGQTYYFKAVSYNRTSTGEIADAPITSIVFQNTSLLPKSVTNLLANGNSSPTTYADDSSSSTQPDIVLTWQPKVRGTEDLPTSFIECEGLFEVRVYAGSSLVRTVKSSDSNPFFNTWTYTEAMNISDNGGLATELIFEVYNYFDSARYSVATSITVTLA